MDKRMLLIGVAILGLAGIVAGCGSESSTETQGEPLSRNAFVKQATQICEDSRQELQKSIIAYQRDNGSLNPSDVGVKAVAATLLPVEKRTTENLEGLVPPEEIADRYQAYLEAREETIGEIEERELSSNSEIFEAFKGSDKMAASLQIQACSFS